MGCQKSFDHLTEMMIGPRQRLKAAQMYPSEQPAPSIDLQYTFDPVTGKMSSGSAAHAHAVEEIDPNHPDVEYTYDESGNMLTRVEDGVTYTQSWTADNRLAKVEWTDGTGTHEVRFFYDGDGSRLLRITTANGLVTSKTVYIGGIYEKEILTGAESKYYTFAGRAIAVRKKDSAAVEPVITYLFGDHLGSNGLAVDLAGVPTGIVRYLPYGKPRTSLGTLPTDKTFTGQRSEEFGLMDFNARYYDPYITQFIQPDSIVPDPYNALDWNRYLYARGNPLHWT